MSDATVVVRMTENVTGIRLAVSESADLTSPVFFGPEDTVDRIARFDLTGLSAGTEYHYAVELDGTVLTRTVGRLKTRPAASFKFAFGSCNDSGSDDAVFAAIVAEEPDFFIHLGDMHYEDIATANIALFHAAYDEALANGPGLLFRQVASHYVFDDHDYGPNDSDSTFVGRDESVEAYRLRVPHPTLEEAGPDGAIYHSFEVGRCVFIMTDLRSRASPKGNTDNASKTMMGATQKAWFKDLLSDPANDGKFFFWCCSRVFTTSTIAGHDSWAGFTTERTELADHIKANCLGRIAVLTGDRHQLGIDDGTNSDYATGGGGPVPVFMAAPIDSNTNTHGGGTFSEGVSSGGNQYGVVEVTDAGGSTITIDMTGKNSAGSTLVTHQLTPDLS